MRESLRKAKKEKNTTLELVDVILESIQDKKGLNITCLDLREVEDAVADFFIITEGTSTVQVKGIADGIAKSTKEKTNEKPWHVEGYENQEWILVDYVDVVVHVFKQGIREVYNLEDLWSDAVITHHNEI